jgi:hypothetical protein
VGLTALKYQKSKKISGFFGFLYIVFEKLKEMVNVGLKRFIKSKSWLGVALIFLVSLVFIVDVRFFTSPPLRSDDWNWIVWSQIFEPLKAIDLTNRRPLFSTLLSALTPLFGLRIQWYYLINWMLLFFSAVVFYLIVKNSFPKHQWLALPAALVFLIYPVNYARTWLIILINHFAFLLALCAILLMVKFSRSGKILPLVIGNVLFLISLCTYEAGLGIVMLAAFILCCFARELPKKRRLLMLSFLLTAVVFILWRTYIQPDLLNLEDFYLENVNLSVPTLGKRYIQGCFIFLFNWIGPLLFGFEGLKYWVFVAVCGVVMLFFVVFLPKILRTAKSNDNYIFEDRITQIKSLLRAVLVGGMFWIAGYLPVISLYQPTFYGDSSRVNFSSIPGASLALAAGITCLSTLIVHRKGAIKRLVFISIIVLVVLGMVYQVHSQNERYRVWEINKNFWQSAFEIVPGLESGTIVIIAVPGYEELEPFEMLPFRGDWEAQSALNVLYNDPSLFAEYYYMDIPNHADNWVPVGGDLSRYVFLYYDTDSSKLRIIEDVESALELPVSVDHYNPQERLIDFCPEMGTYRFLVD